MPVAELGDKTLDKTPVQYAPAGQGLHEACAAVSWYCPGAHVMQAAVAAPPLLCEPAAQLPDTAARPAPAQYMPGVQGVAAAKLVEGRQNGDAAPPEE